MKTIILVLVLCHILAGAAAAEQIEEKTEPPVKRPDIHESREVARHRAMSNIIKSVGNAEATHVFVNGPLGTNKDAQATFIILQNQRIIELLEQIARK